MGEVTEGGRARGRTVDRCARRGEHRRGLVSHSSACTGKDARLLVVPGVVVLARFRSANCEQHPSSLHPSLRAERYQKRGFPSSCIAVLTALSLVHSLPESP